MKKTDKFILIIEIWLYSEWYLKKTWRTISKSKASNSDPKSNAK